MILRTIVKLAVGLYRLEAEYVIPGITMALEAIRSSLRRFKDTLGDGIGYMLNVLCGLSDSVRASIKLLRRECGHAVKDLAELIRKLGVAIDPYRRKKK